MHMDNLKKSAIAGFFSIFIIGTLTYLSYETEYGLFLVASFGSSMVLILGYPESPFAKGRNVFFGHIMCYSILVSHLSFSITFVIPIAVGLGIFFMILLNSTHPPAGGNPILIILGGHSFDFLLSPLISGCVVIILQAYLINNVILKRDFKLF